jgi:acetyl-CoA synthetase
MTQPAAIDLSDRVHELMDCYSRPTASAGYLLCDRHDPSSTAYTIVAPDLSGVIFTYGELRGDSERFAAGLKSLGVGPGDRVATLMGKSIEYLIALLGIWRLGAVHVPLFTAFAPSAIAFRLLGSDAKVVVCDDAQRPKLVPGADIPTNAPWKVVCSDASNGTSRNIVSFADLLVAHKVGFPAATMGGDAPIIHVFTSGTTGRPKGVIVPIKALACFQAYAEFGLGLKSDDVFWCAADPGWAYGLYFGILGSFTTGVPSILLKGGFDAKSTYGVLSQYGVTNFAAAPTVYRSLRASGVLSPKHLKLRNASSAGEPLTPDVNEWAVDALGVVVHDHYGQTEAGMLVNNHHHPRLKRDLKTGSMGQAMPGWSALVLEEHEDVPAKIGELGRLAIEIADSPFAWFSGYAGDPAKSAEKFAGAGRWYLTGDLARMH